MLSLGVKSFLVSSITGSISQAATIGTLFITKNKILALFVLQVLGTLLAYSAQSYIFGFSGGFFGPVLLRWMICVTVTLFLSYKFVIYIENLEKVQRISNKLKGIKKIIFDYLSIMMGVFLTFILWELPMRKLYIFNNNTNTDLYGFLIISVISGFVFYDQKILN